MGEPQGSSLVDGVCCELVGGPEDIGVPRPPALYGTSWGSVQMEMNSGGKLELDVPLVESGILISCVALDEVPAGIYCCVRILHVIRGKGSDWFSHQWPDILSIKT